MMHAEAAIQLMKRFDEVVAWKTHVAIYGDRPEVNEQCTLSYEHKTAAALFAAMVAYELNYYNVWRKKQPGRAAGYLAWLLNGRHKAAAIKYGDWQWPLEVFATLRHKVKHNRLLLVA